MTSYIGQQFGNYRLLRLLGQGGFAEVYLGEHLRLKMQAAVKVLHINLIGKEIEAFQSEAQTLANLGHPHIIRVLDFDVQQGIPFLVLDYAPNGSLREKHPRGTPVPQELVVSYVQQISSALQYAHEQRLIHRDIKPENMLMGKQGEILLSDFGIASVAHSTSSMSTQAAIGTLSYMAPEQIQGKPRPASDQYALAVTVYQWLSGTLPFQGNSSEVIAQHLAVEPPPLRSKAPHVSPAMEEVVMTALKKDPGKRFGSVQAFATALAHASERGLAQQSGSSSFNASTMSPGIPPTLPATPGAAVQPTPLAPQPVAPGVLAANVDTPVPAQMAHTPNAGGMAFPPPPPLAYPYVASPPRKTNPWLIWLIGSLIIAVVGGIAAIVIPALVVYGPHGRNWEGTNPGITTPTSNQSTLPGDVSNCRVGSEAKGAFQKSSSFPVGTVVLLLCDTPSGANAFTDQEKLVGRSSGAVQAYVGNGGKQFLYFAELDTIDTYTWTVSTAIDGSRQIASIQFLVTESTESRNVGPDITRCQVGTGYDTNSGTVQGAGSSFPIGTTVYLACSPVSSDLGIYAFADKLFSNSSTLVDTGYRSDVSGGQGNFDNTYNIYYNSVTLTGAGKYTWVVYYRKTSEVWVDFQVG
ncbi:MAG TPA: protein kinase [Ktedonobacteraceae bacterium]